MKFAEWFFKLNKSTILKLILIVAIVILIGNAIAISRDYQDSWILEGLEIPFVLFIVTYALAFFSEKSVLSLVALAVIGRAVFLLIPNLKYVWFQGTAIDQFRQYNLASYLYNGGHIANQGPVSVIFYSDTPFIHVSFAIFSIILGVPVVDSVKYIPVLLSSLYPLLTYIIVKNLKFPDDTTILKYSLFISSLPQTALSYVVTGSQFGVLLILLILTSLVTLLQKNDRSHWFVLALFVLVLPMTHSVSSLVLAALLLVVILFQRISYFRLKPHLQFGMVMITILTCAAWLTFSAKLAFAQILQIVFLRIPTGTTSSLESIPSRFFELLRIDIFGAVKTALVYYGADLFLLFLALSGLVVLVKTRKRLNSVQRFFLLFASLMLGLLPIGFLLRAGPFRLLYYASLFFPILSAILVERIRKKSRWMPAILFGLLISLATIQLYPCQPLMPSANVISKDLPPNESIGEVNEVNTVYQRRMIEFAQRYVDGPIACDLVTQVQIEGLTDFNFSLAYLTPYYPLDKNQPEIKYDYFLVHLPGISGVFSEPAELRTRDLILNTIYNSSIVYTNGESFILHH